MEAPKCGKCDKLDNIFIVCQWPNCPPVLSCSRCIFKCSACCVQYCLEHLDNQLQECRHRLCLKCKKSLCAECGGGHCAPCHFRCVICKATLVHKECKQNHYRKHGLWRTLFFATLDCTPAIVNAINLRCSDWLC